jgi:hypothetical protein
MAGSVLAELEYDSSLSNWLDKETAASNLHTRESNVVVTMAVDIDEIA